MNEISLRRSPIGRTDNTLRANIGQYSDDIGNPTSYSWRTINNIGAGLSPINASQSGNVLVVELNRPEKRNALRLEDLQELRRITLEAGGDSGIRCMVIAGAGGHFSAGADIDELQGIIDSHQARQHATIAQATCDALEQSPLPIIAAISGFCVGGGLEIAMSCDLRIADREARFGQVELGIGSIAAWGGIRRLPRLVGVPQAKRLVYTFEHIDAKEALRIGLVEELCDPGTAVEASLRIAQRIATSPPNAVAWSKRALDHAYDVPLNAGLQSDREGFAALSQGQEFAVGVEAFLNKSPRPNW